MARRRQLHLNAFLHVDGHHEAAWRRPGLDPQQPQQFSHYLQLAQIAERGRFDSLFLADNLALSDNVRFRSHSPFEPLTLLAALAVGTEHIGLIATASATYYDPFHLARLLSSVDHISGGRAGWNIVTSAYHDEAANFGRDARPDHAVRYERAAEFVDVVQQLWDSWDDDAIVADRERGYFLDRERIHAIEHDGQYLKVRGPFTAPRSVQGRPLLVQAGASEAGVAFAARYAEAVFTAADNVAEAKSFYDTVKRRVAESGRNPDDVTILPGLSPVVASTEAAARQKLADLDELVVPEYGVAQLSKIFDHDLSTYALDGPMPELPRSSEGMQGRVALIADLAAREHLTIRQLVVRLAGGRGHHVVAGTASQVADEIEYWFHERAADGFNVMPPTLPEGLDDFVVHVVPELQRRGLFRSEYDGTTLRSHYGLARPDPTTKATAHP